MAELSLTLGGRQVRVSIQTAIVAGWTGRDRRALEEHIAELERVGVQRPSSTPIFYRVSASRVTTEPEIEATPSSSGEVEAVLLRHDGAVWLGAGSDHTDRELETYSVAASKQLCEKPIAAQFWAYEEVAPHWDRLVIRSWIRARADEALYQEGTLAALLPSDQLLERAEPRLTDGTLMFCGTVPARGGIRPAGEFKYELEDPVLGRAITGGYMMRALPLIS
jgi:hypothetical protein